jgi:hypothetical protein
MTIDQDFEPVGQRQAQIAPFFTRILPAWTLPGWENANAWRRVVRSQPLAIAARDTLISYLLGTPWEVRAKNPNDKKKYEKEIEYYTNLLNFLDGYDFETHLDMVCQDLLDTPFGAASELGREGDIPTGKTLWVQHIDSATLYPTNDYDFPVAQNVPTIGVTATQPILFPRHAIDRMYFTPRPEIDKHGWGMSPPEKIFLAIELLFRGDRYYANLLLDTPEAGVLDLLDMSKDSAFEWLESFKTLFSGADPFKVPVLYEHEVPAKWIPFGRPPTELIYNEVTFKYAQIVCAGYGVKIADIGLAKDAARTLAGVIHSERQTRRTGFAVIKSKTIAYFSRMLPSYLQFNWIDQDDEAMISKGRARLANAQAYKTLADARLMGPTELRGQLAADGLYSIQIDPDDLSDIAKLPAAPAPAAAINSGRPQNFTRPKVAPSKGGEGDVTMQRQSLADILTSSYEMVVSRATPPRLRRIVKLMTKALYPSIIKQLKATSIDEMQGWAEAMASLSFDDSRYSELTPATRSAIQGKRSALQKTLDEDRWWALQPHLAMEDLYGSSVGILESGIGDANDLTERAAYEEGLIDELLEPVPQVKAEELLGAMLALSNELIAQADLKTRDLMTRVAMSAICYSLAAPTVAKAIQGGLKLDQLLMDDGYIDMATQNFQEGLQELLKIRKSETENLIAETLWRRGVKEYFARNGVEEGVYEFSEGSGVNIDTPKLLDSVKLKLSTLWTGG